MFQVILTILPYNHKELCQHYCTGVSVLTCFDFVCNLILENMTYISMYSLLCKKLLLGKIFCSHSGDHILGFMYIYEMKKNVQTILPVTDFGWLVCNF